VACSSKLARSKNLAKDIAIGVTVIELSIIAVIKWKYMKGKLISSFWQVYLGGGIVIFAGIFLERIISKFIN
jgi:hypothetical protein